MGKDELWVESYQGEVLGEALFGLLASREKDPEHRRQLEILTLLERTTKELAGPIFEQGALDCGDTVATVAAAADMADAVAGLTWEEFLGSFEPVITQFLARYRQLVELAGDETERAIAAAYVAHEEALAVFVRRALGQEEGEPLQAILALPHVAAAVPS